jgi:ParB-like chromosome segregation protein Spo0J
MSRVKEVPISQIIETFNVREVAAPDPERVRMFVRLYEENADVPPILLDADSFEIIDGRTRLAAKRTLNHLTIPSLLIPHQKRGPQLAAALAANMGGSLAPTVDDITGTFVRMITAGMSLREITDALIKHQPTNVSREYFKWAKKRIDGVKLKAAAKAISKDNLTASQAAEKYGLELEQLQREISGEATFFDFDLETVNKALTECNRSRSNKLFALLRKVLDQHRDGHCDADAIEQVFKHVNGCLTSTRKSVDKYYKDFKHAKTVNDGAVNPKP